MSYPVKYAAMPVLVLKEWDSCLGKNKNSFDIYYIVSRCHVLRETKRFFEMNPCDVSYKVRFPYSITQSIDPSISVTHGNECFVERVYNEDELGILKTYLVNLNRKLLSNRIYLTDYDSDKLKELTSSYNNMSLEYSLLENELETILREEMPFENGASLVRK